jgi:hypothetical protein
MYLHANAKLGLAGRCALVKAIEGGSTLREAAAAFRISPATAHRWWHLVVAMGVRRLGLRVGYVCAVSVTPHQGRAGRAETSPMTPARTRQPRRGWRPRQGNA